MNQLLLGVGRLFALFLVGEIEPQGDATGNGQPVGKGNNQGVAHIVAGAMGKN